MPLDGGKRHTRAVLFCLVEPRQESLVDLYADLASEADGWDPSPFRYFAANCEKAAGWRVVKLPCSHDVMVDMPKELAAELQKLA